VSTAIVTEDGACVCTGERQTIYEMDSGMSVACCQGCGAWSVLKPVAVVKPGVIERVIRWLVLPTQADDDRADFQEMLAIGRERSRRLDGCMAVLVVITRTVAGVCLVMGGGW